MKGKLSTLILICMLLLVLVGCEQRYTPDPEVESFLNTEISAEKAVEAVKTVQCTITETQFNKKGDELGKNVYDFVIDKSDADNFMLEITQTLSGSYVENGVTLKQTSLSKVEGKYIFVKTIAGEVVSDEVDEQFVIDYIASFFYTNNNAYNEGGLYYGDFFMLYIYKYPPTSFSIDKENNLCIFDEKMDIYDNTVGNVRLHQISKINSLGLLLSNYERYESVDSDLVLLSELTASYIYF